MHESSNLYTNFSKQDIWKIGITIIPTAELHKHIIEQKNGKIKPRARNELLCYTELEIVLTYNSELRGICNYYSIACNFNKLNYFEDRLTANVCELCGTTESEHYELHHINKIKNLKGKEWWEQVMIAKRRKTIVVCRKCHKDIHNQ